MTITASASHLPRSLTTLVTIALLGTTLTACQTRPVTPVTTQRTLPAIPVGLALGGGGARGFAHIGVIEELEANGIRSDIITGSSAGSIVGSLYASGMTVPALKMAASQVTQAQVLDLAPSGQGLISGERLRQYINQQVGQRPLERLPIRFGAVATDRDSGEMVLLQQGETGQAVRASASVPLLFVAPLVGTRRLVDGAVAAPVPVTAARRMGARLVIAVDISAVPGRQRGLFQQLGQILANVDQSRLQQELAQADVVIRPELAQISSIQMEQRDLAIAAGRAAARQALPQIRQAQARLRSQP